MQKFRALVFTIPFLRTLWLFREMGASIPDLAKDGFRLIFDSGYRHWLNDDWFI